MLKISHNRTGTSILLFLVSLLVLPASVRSESAGLDGKRAAMPGVARDLHTYLARLEGLGFAGAALVAVGDELLLSRGYGLADRDRGIPWTAGTVSSIGSITKQFTAAAIMRLAADGKLSTDDPITRFFDGVPEDKRGITVHHLLTHTAGLAGILGDDFALIERDELVALAMAEPLERQPGEAYAYSNLGYSLLAAIVEKVSGRDYEEYLRRELLVPAGVFETGYVLAPFEPVRLATGYRQGTRWGTVVERPWLDDGPSWHLRGNGGIHSTIFDMYRWLRALSGDRVLPPSARKKLFSPAADEGGGSFYGYGWAMRETERGTRVIGHTGGNGILFADIRWYPDEDSFVFMMTSTAELPAEEITPQLAAILFDEPVTLPPAVVPVDPARLAAVAGTYRLAQGGEMVVAATEGTLVVEPLGPDALAAVLAPRSASAPGMSSPQAAGRYTARVEKVIDGVLAGDFEPLTDAYGGELALRELREIYSRRLERLEAQMGPVGGFEVLGSVGGDTFFRIDFRDGAFWGRYLWDGETLEGLQILDGPPSVVLYPTATTPRLELQAFELGTDLGTRIAFPATGRLVVRKNGGDLVASRITEREGGDP